MSHEPVPQDSGLKAVEAALGSLAPARSRIDRDLVMFRAGQASARRASSGRRPWMAAAAGLASVALGEAAFMARRPPPVVVERVVVVREPAPAPAALSNAESVAQTPMPAAWRPSEGSPGLGESAYERLSSQVIRYGLDGLPGPLSSGGAGPAPSPVFSRQSLQEELRKDLGLGDPS